MCLQPFFVRCAGPVRTVAPNTALSSGASITVEGTNFGSSDLTPSMLLGTSQCATTVWSSFLSVVCNLHQGHFYALDISMTMSEITGTLEKGFSCDAPAISYSPSVNEPTTSGASVTLSGTNFGYMNLTPTTRIGKSLCLTTAWMSVTTVLCDTAAGYSQTLAGALTVASLVGTKESYFTYDSPVLTRSTCLHPTVEP